ncbi:MAG: hypothetical protein KC435_14410 [Thermomicrobiales bacterium]|nr:hypothetical protein [Thermomicrobiales bacterium]
MRIPTRILTTAAAAVLIPLASLSANAQVPSDTTLQAQAAAMTLTSADLPTGYTLIGETFLPLPDGVDGVTSHYVSVYTNTTSGQQIRSYVYTFASEDQAKSGFDTLEGNEADTLSDESLELGTGSAELTTGTYQNADDQTVGTADVTFVQGSAVVGVAVDNPDGSAPDSGLAKDLAGIADTRAQAVAAGNAPVDLTLPAKIVPITDGGTVIQAGYLDASEAEAIYGTQGSAIASAKSTYVVAVGYGEDGAAPRVTIGVSTYASADDAKKVVEQADQIFPPLSDVEKVEDVKLDGTDSVVAYHYTSRDGEIASQESYRIVYSQGDTVTVVDVQAASDTEVAQAAANAIAGPQLTCQTEGDCVRPEADGVLPAN